VSAPPVPPVPPVHPSSAPQGGTDPGDRAPRRRVHFLGIGGAGLSALARIQLTRGDTVSGSDQEDSTRIADLRGQGARIRVGPSPDPTLLAAELTGVDVVVASSALPDDHPEIVAARALGLPVRRRSAWLPELTAGYRLVAVAGSHGKTGTSAMLTLVLRAAGLDPTAVIGAEVPQLGGAALVGGGELFVLEADEYGGAFAGLEPELAIITNVEWEHPDLFPDQAAVRVAFAAFAARVRPGGRLVVCGDDPGVTAVLAALARRPGHATVVDYGFGDGRTWRAVDLRTGTEPGAGTVATVLRAGAPVGTLRLIPPGRHMVLNALAVLATATELGVPIERTLETLATYTGAARRFQPLGSAPLPTGAPADRTADRTPDPTAEPSRPVAATARVEVVDDYAHHPTEIRATLAGARQRAAGRAVWAVMQPHTYSRLAALLDDFAVAFADADRLYVTDIYASRERDDLGLHATDLVRRIVTPTATAHVSWPDLVGRLVADLGDATATGSRGVLLLTLGAGTVTEVGPRLLAALNGRGGR
jgi:UDP-N-acetylmuramate--alanine ligase